MSEIRIDRVYTKVGDKGKTLLADGSKVYKDDLRIETYGTVDELNAHVGLLIDFLKQHSEHFSTLLLQLKTVQNELFDIGGELATPLEVLKKSPQRLVQSSDVSRLEAEIDEMNDALEPLKNFVLPGGHLANSQAHVCRCVCRRAERRLVQFSRSEEVRDCVKVYLNRLSDWFFVVSRFISYTLSIPELLWASKK